MSFPQMGAIALLAYLALLVGVAELARRARRDLTPADHCLGGRELGVFVLFLTLYATAYSGNSLLGYPGEAYRRGFSWIMATGFMMSIIVCFHALVPKLRPIAAQHGFVTPGDWIRFRFAGEAFGRHLVRVVGVLMAVALANFLFAQLKAMGEITETVTGGLVPYAAGVILLAAMILLYETLGGMRAVAWTDAVQGVLMLVGLGALLFWLLGEAGGLQAMTNSILEVRPEAGNVPDVRERTNWASTIVLLGLASVVYPQAIQRIYAARDGKTLRRSLAFMTFMPLTTTWVVTLIGLAAIPRIQGLGVVQADAVMPLVLGEWAGVGSLQAWGAVVVFMGALAAIMSTADSVLLSLGSIVAEDLQGASRLDPRTTRVGKRAAAAIMIAMAGVAIVSRDVTLWGLIELKMELLIQCVPSFLLALHWRRLRAGPCLAGAVIGAGVASVAALLGVKRIEGVHLGVLALGLNLAIAVIGSLQAPSGARAGQGART